MAEVLARAYITVARVNDGVNGADAIHLALDQVVGSVPCGLLLQTSSPSNILYTTLTLYQGGKEIDMPAPTITLTSPQTGVVLDSTPGKSRRYKIIVYDHAGLSETVTFKVVYQNVEYSAVFTVNKLKPGDKGDDGTGISAVTSYYAISALTSGVTRANTTGWVKGVFQQPTAEKPYAWKYTETTYTNGKEATYTDCELIFTYNAGVNPNLLEDTDFRDDAHMGAWDTKLGTSWVDGVTPESDYSIGIVEQGLQGRNCFRGGTFLTAEKINYRAILRQPIITKLRPSTWYTLSYWLRVSADSMFYTPVSSGNYGFNGYDLYLTAGHTYRFAIRGYISAEAQAAGKVLWADINGPDGKWDFQKNIDISSTSSENKSLEFSDVPKTGRYTVRFYSYPNDGNTTQTVTIERAYIQDKTQQVGVYVHGGVVDTTVKGFVNGIEQTLGSEGDVYYGIDSIFRRYTYTFKTKATLPESTFVNFRLFPDCVASKESDGARAGISYADICMPKLEEGMMATGYVANEKSLVGDNGKNGIDGCVQRIFRTDTYMAGETYHNDSESTSNGLKFIDYMAEEDSSMATGWNIYQCKATHTGAATWAADKNQWVKVAVNAGSAFFTNLIAKNAKVKLLTGAQMIATENDGTPVAGVVNGDYPLWVGDEVDGKAEEAPFRVSRAGKMYSKDAEIEGKVTATSGKIGKFDINQGYLGNSELGLYLDDNEIIFNGDGLAEGLQAIIGAFFHAGQAGPYLGRFTNGRKISSGTNYGLYFAIANGRYNFAALGLGDIVMRGNVEGIALNSVSFTANNQSEIIDLSKGKYVVVNNRYSNNAVVLPSLLDFTMYLNPVLSDKPSFAFRLTIIADLGTNDFVIYGRNKLASGNSTPWNNENYPLLTTWDGQNWDKYELGAGDSMELMLVYDPSRTSTIGGYSTKWTARIINLQQ